MISMMQEGEMVVECLETTISEHCMKHKLAAVVDNHTIPRMKIPRMSQIK